MRLPRFARNYTGIPMYVSGYNRANQRSRRRGWTDLGGSEGNVGSPYQFLFVLWFSACLFCFQNVPKHITICAPQRGRGTGYGLWGMLNMGDMLTAQVQNFRCHEVAYSLSRDLMRKSWGHYPCNSWREMRLYVQYHKVKE